MKPSVLIVGDSWAGGEWSGGDHTEILHGGLGEYFQQAGHHAKVLYSPGKGNQHNVSRLCEFLHLAAHRPDIILFVVSDPLRNYGLPGNEIKTDVYTYGGLFELASFHLRQDCVALDRLAKQYASTIYLIGGLGTVSVDISDLTNLECMVKSWPELLLGDSQEFKDFDWQTFGVWGKWQSVLANAISYNDSIGKKVIDQMAILLKSSVVFKHPLFQPDGGHPNRQGHKILFEHIFRKLNL